jgi:RNA polymerase sigma factor (sigma-70 family)
MRRQTEREGFDRLWRVEYVRVARTAFLITGDREDARDLAQDAFALAWRKWAEVSQLDHPGAWLQRTVAFLSLNWRRRRNTERRKEFYPSPPSDVDEVGLDLREALQQLTPSQRAVVVLRYYADLSVEQVAQAVGKRPGTIRALSSQALSRLRSRIERTEVNRNG